MLRISKYRPVDYITIPDRGHCDLDEESDKRYKEIALNYILEAIK